MENPCKTETPDVFRILLVDDEIPILRLMIKILDKNGYDLVYATDSDQALDLIRRQEVDLIISDHQMPGMNGIPLFEQLSRTHPEIVKILVTGRAELRDLVTAINDTNLFRILIKPFSPKELLTCVRDACQISWAGKNARLLEESRETIRQKNAQYYGLVESLQDAIVVTDPSGIVQYVNKACQLLWQKEKDEFVGHAFGLTVTPWESAEVDIVSGSQSNIVADMRTIEIIWKGKKAFLTSIRDVTQRKTLEKQLQQAVLELSKANVTIITQQKAILRKERLKLLVQLAGATAHELNQPLTVLNGEIELLKLNQDAPETWPRSLKAISGAGKKIADIVRKIQTLQHERVTPYAGGGCIIDLFQTAHILCVFESAQAFGFIRDALKDHSDYKLVHVDGVASARNAMQAHQFDFVLTQAVLSDGGFEDICGHAAVLAPNAEVSAIREDCCSSKEETMVQESCHILDRSTLTDRSVCRLVTYGLEKGRLYKTMAFAEDRLARLEFLDTATGMCRPDCFMTLLGKEMTAANRNGKALCLCMMGGEVADAGTGGRGMDRRAAMRICTALEQGIRAYDVACLLPDSRVCVLMPGILIDGAALLANDLLKKAATIEESDVTDSLAVWAGVVEMTRETVMGPDRLVLQCREALDSAMNKVAGSVVRYDHLQSGTDSKLFARGK